MGSATVTGMDTNNAPIWTCPTCRVATTGDYCHEARPTAQASRKLAHAEALLANSRAAYNRWERISAKRSLTSRERVMFGNAYAELIGDTKNVELIRAKIAAGIEP